MKRHHLIPFLPFVFLLFFAGIMRHDVLKQQYLSLALEKQFRCAGRVFKNGKPGGSCTLIGRKYVLSAAHVFIESDYRKDTIVTNGQTIYVNQPYNLRVGKASDYAFEFGGKRYPAKSLIMHPTYLDSARTSCDIILIELSKEVSDVEPAVIGSEVVEVGTTVTGVGYGGSGVANMPEKVGLNNDRIAGENTIDSIGGFVSEGKPTLLFADFDHPDNQDCNRMGSAIPLPMEYTITGGDSGGGLFQKRGLGWELVGVASGTHIEVDRMAKTGYYGQTMSWTQVPAFQEWVRQHMTK